MSMTKKNHHAVQLGMIGLVLGIALQSSGATQGPGPVDALFQERMRSIMSLYQDTAIDLAQPEFTAVLTRSFPRSWFRSPDRVRMTVPARATFGIHLDMRKRNLTIVPVKISRTLEIHTGMPELLHLHVMMEQAEAINLRTGKPATHEQRRLMTQEMYTHAERLAREKAATPSFLRIFTGRLADWYFGLYDQLFSGQIARDRIRVVCHEAPKRTQ